MKQLYLLLLLVASQVLFSQNPVPVFGELTSEDISTNSFPGDPSASGIVLYERAEYTVGTNEHFVILKEKVYQKIKVIDSKNFEFGTVSIPLYSRRDSPEVIENFRAVTHNGSVQKSVMPDAVFEEKESKYWKNLKFTFPDIQDGSILEYTYEIHSPYFFRLRGWNFMNKLPTLYSELHTEIPGNYIYNRSLFGNRSLDINKATIKKGCFHLPGFKVAGDCEIATYAMKNVPAFKEEDYMLSHENYIPILAFELAQIADLSGAKHYYANSWKNVDDRLKKERNFGSQLNLNRFFRNNLPAEILSISNPLERAKAVFYEVQRTMNWNGETPYMQDVDVKKAFENGAGNAMEINIALTNALSAVDLDAKIMLISNRSKRAPTKEHPAFYGFNYPIVHLKIDDQLFLLDATEKWMSFDILPIRALNQYGRVIDFKKGSYWEDIKPFDKSIYYANAQMKLNADGQLTGTIQETYSGFFGAEKRRINMRIDKAQQLSKKQQETEHLNISNFIIENEEDLEKPYVEKYDFEYDELLSGNKIYLNPFVMEELFAKNLFQQNQRLYPIDFGFPMINNYLISIDLDEAYSVVKLPENQRISLPNNDADLFVVYDNSQENKINIRFNLRLNNYHYPKEAYQSLKEFFSQMIKTQSDSPIEIVRK